MPQPGIKIPQEIRQSPTLTVSSTSYITNIVLRTSNAVIWLKIIATHFDAFVHLCLIILPTHSFLFPLVSLSYIVKVLYINQVTDCYAK